MRRWIPIVLVSVASLIVGAGGSYLFMRYHGAGAGGGETQEQGEKKAPAHEEGAGGEVPPATLPVEVASVKIGTITPVIVAFGAIEQSPGAGMSIALPAEIIVKRVAIVPGQSVKAGEALAEFTLSPDTELQIKLAHQDVAAAENALKAAKSRLALQLGTNVDVTTAEAVEAAAKSKLERLSTAAVPPDGVVRASSAGVVRSVAMVAGSVAPAESSLVVIDIGDERLAALGVEPSQAALLIGHEPVALHPLADSGEDTAGQVAYLQPAVDPATRLRRVMVRGSEGGTETLSLPIGTPLRAEITLPQVTGAVLMPRAAVLPTAEGDVVFVVEDGKAHRRVVRTGDRVGGSGPDADLVRVLEGVKPGETVVIGGQGDLVEGSAVKASEDPDDEEN